MRRLRRPLIRRPLVRWAVVPLLLAGAWLYPWWALSLPPGQSNVGAVARLVEVGALPADGFYLVTDVSGNTRAYYISTGRPVDGYAPTPLRALPGDLRVKTMYLQSPGLGRVLRLWWSGFQVRPTIGQAALRISADHRSGLIEGPPTAPNQGKWIEGRPTAPNQGK